MSDNNIAVFESYLSEIQPKALHRMFIDIFFRIFIYIVMQSDHFLKEYRGRLQNRNTTMISWDYFSF